MGWHGPSYDGIAGPQADSGAALLCRLALPPSAKVVDAGCGTGRVTEELLELRRDVQVLGLDASPSMLEAARLRLSRFGSRVELRQADLTDPWPVEKPVHAVLSTHTFHWIPDHPRLYHNIFDVLRPGGALVAVAGGYGSLQRVRVAAQRLGVGVAGRNTYATDTDTTRWLQEAGFADIWAWLQPEPMRFSSADVLARYLAEAALAPYDRGPELSQQVAEAIPDCVADFVRLHILARRPSTGT